ncbi:MAG TPA: phage terminase large subunit, partial [Gemmatimonadales bacterium]|nr:phage terminase large subunit [Gemmatimonadales bacterium]
MVAEPCFEDAPPEQRPYRPYGTAQALMNSRAPEIILSGPAGTGKSRAALEKLHLCCQKYPGCRALILRQTRVSLSDSALVTFEEKVLPAGHYLLDGPQRASRRYYRYRNGSEITVAGLDKPGRVMSTEYDMIYIMEAIEVLEDAWEKCTTRLGRNSALPFSQLLADTNPDAPGHWLKQRAERGQCRMLESRHEENPAIWDQVTQAPTPMGRDYLAKLDALTGVRYQRLRLGLWV